MGSDYKANRFTYECPYCNKEMSGDFGDDVSCSDCEKTYETDWETSDDGWSCWLTGVENNFKSINKTNMAREIKFRAWDESQKYMAYQGTPDLENIQSFMHHFANKELMQFTGLLDANGKYIYEGDVVKWGHLKNSKELYHRIALVEINPDIQFKILNYFDTKNKKLLPTDNYIFKFGSFAYTSKELEVIGNIYEDSKLLNQ